MDFGAEDSFSLAAIRLRRHHPVDLSAGTVRKITLKHAQNLAQEQKQTSCLGRLPATGADELIIEADGTMLPVVEFDEGKSQDRRKGRQTAWREVRLCAAQDKSKADAVYGCDMEGVEQLGYRWSHCAGQAGWALNTQLHAVSDGAAWIGKQIEGCFGEETPHLLDFFHLMEYLCAAQKAKPQWMEPRKRWLQVQKKRLLNNQTEKVIQELAPHLEPPNQEDQPIRAAWRYLSNHRSQLDYKTALEKGRPIGSGLIESGHRHVLQKRLKLSGAWWTQQNLNSMTQLRVCRANQRWDSYWKKAA